MITARELRYKTGRPMSSIYRLMSECGTRRCIYDDAYGTVLVVDEGEFMNVAGSKRRGNPRYLKKKAELIEKAMGNW